MSGQLAPAEGINSLPAPHRAASAKGVNEMIETLLDRPIAYHRVFVTLTGSVTAAVMLSQALYWSKRTTDDDGWFYKTQEEWEEETGLKRSEQENARRLLRQSAYWQEELKGIPAKLFFKLDIQKLESALLGDDRVMTLDEVLNNDQAALARLSRAGHMRAVKLDPKAVFVDYAAVLRAHGLQCFVCGQAITRGVGQRDSALVFDHQVPLAKGGAHTEENVRPAHAVCNSRKCDALPKADKSDTGKQTCLLAASKQACLDKADKSASGKQTSLLAASKQACLDKADRSASGKQTFNTETTSEITSETTSESARGGEIPARVSSTVTGELNPEVQAIYEECSGAPLGIHRAGVLQAAGIADVQAWRKTCSDWRANGYSFRNLTGLIEKYRREAERPAAARQRPANLVTLPPPGFVQQRKLNALELHALVKADIERLQAEGRAAKERAA